MSASLLPPCIARQALHLPCVRGEEVLRGAVTCLRKSVTEAEEKPTSV